VIRTWIAASAVALSSVGVLVAPALAHALPDCEQWGFAGESIIVEPGTGWRVTFFSNGTEATGTATASNDRGESKVGEISGGLDGGRFTVVVDYKNGQRQGYRGGVYGNDGVASGVTSNGIANESGKPFTSRLTCLEPG
jgi:hypothetical protein